MTRSRRLVTRPPSDASRRPLESTPLQAGMRLRSDQRRSPLDRVTPCRPEGDRSPVRSKGPNRRWPRRLIALRQMPQDPRAGHRFCAADISNRERLAPTGNRAIPDDRSSRLSKLFQRVIDRRKAGGMAGEGEVGTLGIELGPITIILYALCGLVKNNMGTISFHTAPKFDCAACYRQANISASYRWGFGASATCIPAD